VVIEEMAKVINPAIWHNQSNTHFDDLSQATPDQKALYSFLLEKAENPRVVFDQTRFAPYTGWREYLQTLDTLRGLWAQVQGKECISESNITLNHKEVFGIQR
jgi:hypothetical protein